MQPNGITVVKDNSKIKEYNRNKKLSLKAKGLLGLCLDLPPRWDFSLRGIAIITKENKDTIGAIIAELIKAGYCLKNEIRDNGKFKGYHYTFFENQDDNKPCPKFSDTATVSEKTVSEKTVSEDLGHNIKGNIYKINNSKEGGEGNSQKLKKKSPSLPESVLIWLKLMDIEITATGAKLIEERVKNLECWRQTLEGWLASSWAKTNIDGQLNRYSKKIKEGDFTEEITEKEKTAKEIKEEEELRKLIYG